MTSPVQPPSDGAKTAQRSTEAAAMGVPARVNLTNRSDPAVAAALTRRCRLCHAIPGLDCRSVIDRMPLAGGAIVHFYRMEEGK